jgi:tRNA(Ile)-lysidine synthase
MGGAVARFGRDLGRLIDLDKDTVLVAVSGGADSIALLLLTHAVLRERCVAATVDHGIRTASASEAAFVASLCAQRGIEHRILTGDLPQRVGRTANLSTRARSLRYRLLEEMLAARELRWLATAHHADDQLETFVMRANRGAGVAGLAGIRRHGARIIRPLLDWRRDELARLVAGEGIEAVDDPANSDDRYDRARLRKVLAEIDWLDAPRIGESAAALAQADAALQWAADRVFAERVVCSFNRRIFSPGDIPAEITRRVVVRCLAEIDPDCDPDGPGTGRLAEVLAAGRSAMLGNVLVTACSSPAGVPEWHFRPAPPRRAH